MVTEWDNSAHISVFQDSPELSPRCTGQAVLCADCLDDPLTVIIFCFLSARFSPIVMLTVSARLIIYVCSAVCFSYVEFYCKIDCFVNTVSARLLQLNLLFL